MIIAKGKVFVEADDGSNVGTLMVSDDGAISFQLKQLPLEALGQGPITIQMVPCREDYSLVLTKVEPDEEGETDTSGGTASDDESGLGFGSDGGW